MHIQGYNSALKIFNNKIDTTQTNKHDNFNHSPVLLSDFKNKDRGSTSPY